MQGTLFCKFLFHILSHAALLTVTWQDEELEIGLGVFGLAVT